MILGLVDLGGGLRVVWECIFRVGLLIMYLFPEVADMLSFGVVLLVGDVIWGEFGGLGGIGSSVCGR